MQRGDWYLERRWPFFLQQTRDFSGWQPCSPSFAASCPEASGGERQGAEAGRRLFFYMERLDHGSGMDWQRPDVSFWALAV